MNFGLRAAASRLAAASGGSLGLERQLEFWMGQVDPRWSLRELRARVVGVVQETPDTKTFQLAPNRRWPGYRAGQFVRVEVEIDGVRTGRCYSLSSAPTDRWPAITVKRVAGGRVSSFLHERVGVGDVLRLGRPEGSFVVEPLTRALLLVGAGSGVTPLASILRDLVARAAARDVVLVVAARSAAERIFGPALDRLADDHPGVRVEWVIGPRSRGLTPSRLETLVPDWAERHTMFCGPPAMIETFGPRWGDAGLDHRLAIERFTPPARAAHGGPVTLSLLRSGRTLRVGGGDTLLVELERAGLRPPTGCRMGICNTCRSTKGRGVVEDLISGRVSTDDPQEIRLCVSRPHTDLELHL
jgi:stearoyl-CoA 9-desaturase NADPH oxidoreductase